MKSANFHVVKVSSFKVVMRRNLNNSVVGLEINWRCDFLVTVSLFFAISGRTCLT